MISRDNWLVFNMFSLLGGEIIFEMVGSNLLIIRRDFR